MLRPVAVLEGIAGADARKNWRRLEEEKDYARMNSILHFLFAAVIIHPTSKRSQGLDFDRMEIEPSPLDWGLSGGSCPVLGRWDRMPPVTSYLQRYLAGDHQDVWVDLRALGPIPERLAEDCAAVAAETMRRVARHIERLTGELDTLGLAPAAKLRFPTSPEELADLDRLDAEIGGLPAALYACLRHVGGVSFTGDCPQLGLSYRNSDQYTDAPILPDPLVLPLVEELRWSWDEYQENVEDDPDAAEDGFVFDFAPDELHKANYSGATHDIALPSRLADPVLEGVGGREGVTLVEYLRLSITWGGMPGWSFTPEHTPPALEHLRARPDF
ncbi:hypothetical protein ACH4S8_34500 [Streptomyces sp. NPDC021080]|uniref:hypothetical protein n=1 Tax=Streptomyces sp. NPDC021080 TaxID=3365110 RepID=UPI003798604C